MPELPEITALADFLDQRLSGSQLTRFMLPSASALKVAVVSPESLVGRTVLSVGRHGKYLAFTIKSAPEAVPAEGPLSLIVSFAKDGWLKFSDTQPGTSPEGYFAAQLGFSNSGHDYEITLTDDGSWKGLALYIVRQPTEVRGIAELGPDALSPAFDLEEFHRLFTKRQQVKGLLRDQKRIAGIGNGYSDEILHAAKLSPVAIASRLEPDAVERLFRSMKEILQGAIDELAGKGPSELKPAKKASMRVHGKTGEDCPVCGDTVREIAFVGTSLQYCPTCQTNGEVLAKRGAGES
ncbi:DNA-formamidopyrimidine glycosylase family protein [Arthrobacter bambusae]|uniref:DNA-formamidopyrimidine glycosylase family protein n=1 Tax=Arthrobacter bambusae TaxID=1338426 RepID=UPI00278540BB|nr:DNA-formamidopyrimidine glycosylase family protein [Arthrobacter bambusae]MDQ0031968.1 formamidopyrimidine-DNA glycosylase [Arthrobacter bambusae]MDQ0100095.1 formamidopyrimidine-DNA glycosylase [Arthrobacter bambusae]